MPFNGSATANIANGASLSDAIDLAEQRLSGIIIPAPFDAAALTFQGSPDGSAWYELYDSGGPITIPQAQLASDRILVVDPTVFFQVRYLKIRTGTKASPQAQSAARQIQLATVPR